MGKAVRLERIFYKGEQQKEQTRLTQVSISYKGIYMIHLFWFCYIIYWICNKFQSLHAICVVTLALWIPAAILVGWQWLPLLIYGYRPHVPPALVLIASISSEVRSMKCDECTYLFYTFELLPVNGFVLYLPAGYLE